MAKQKQTKRNALRQKLKSLESEILELKSQSSVFDANSSEYLEKIAKIEERRTKNLKEYYKLRKELREMEEDSLKDNKKEETARTSQTRHLKQIKEAQDDLLLIQEKSSILMHSFNTNSKKSAEILGITTKHAKELSGQFEILKDLTGANKEQNDVMAKSMKNMVSNASGLNNLAAKITENMENIAENGYRAVETYSLERKLKEQIAALDLKTNEMSYDAWEAQRKIADAQLREFQYLKLVNKKLEEKSKLMKQAKEDSKATKLAFLAMMTGLPGGNFLFNKLGLGKVIDGSKTVGQTIRGWGKSLLGFAIAAPFAAILGIINLMITAFKFLIGTAFELDTRIANLSKNLSISRGEATGLERRFAGMALKMDLVGINTEQFGETVGFLAEEYGASVNKIMQGTGSSRFVEDITVLREKFQLTNEEALNFGKISSIMGVSMGNLAYQSVKITKAFLNNRQIIKAMSNVPQIMANGMKGAVDRLVQFVAKAKMLGIDLKGFSEALEGTLDIESSLEKQFTAETITGIHFKNMDAIRLATNSMQYDKAFDMLMSNIGQVKSLADMPGGLIGVRSIADLFGFSLEEFTKMFNKFQELKNVFGGANPMQEAQKYFNMTAAQLRKEVATMGAGAKKTFLENLAAEKEGADIQAAFMDKINKIKLELMDSTLPIVDEMHAIFKELMGNQELKDLFSSMTKRLPSIIKSLIEMGRQLKEIVKSVFGFLVKFGAISDPLDKTKQAVAGMNEGFFNWNKIIGTTIGLFLGYKGLGWAIDSFKSNVLGIGPASGKAMKQMMQEMTQSNQQIMQQLQNQQGGNVTPMSGKTGGKPKFNSMKAGLIGGGLALGGELASQYFESQGNTTGAGWANLLSNTASGAAAGAMFGPWGMAIGGAAGLGLGLYNNWDAISGKSKPKELPWQQKNQQMTQSATPQTAKELSETSKELAKFNDNKIWSAARAIAEFEKSFKLFNTTLSGFKNAGMVDVLKEAITVFNSADSIKMQSFATGVLNLSNAISELNKNLIKLDIVKLEKASEKINPGAGGILSSVSNFAGSIFSGVKSIFSGNQPQTTPVTNATVTTNQGTSQVSVNVNTTALEQKIDKLIGILNQPTYIKIGERTVEAIAGEITWKKQMKIGSDNTYGYTVRDTD